MDDGLPEAVNRRARYRDPGRMPYSETFEQLTNPKKASTEKDSSATSSNMGSAARPLSLADALSVINEPRFITMSQAPFSIVHTNKAWCEATGYSFLEVVNKALIDFLRLTGPQGASAHEMELQRLQAALAQGQAASFTLLSHRRDGTPYANHISLELVRGGSHWMGTLSTRQVADGSVPVREDMRMLPPLAPAPPVCYKDMAQANPAKRARRLDKPRLADMLSNSTQPLVLCDKNAPHTILHPNQPWLEMCGYTLEEVQGLTNKLLTGPETDLGHIGDLLRCVRNEETSVQCIVNYKKGGRRFVNQVVTLPVYDEQDELAAFMSMLHEVDEVPTSAQALEGEAPAAQAAPNLNPGHAHLWAGLQLHFERHASTLRDSSAEAARKLLSNHEYILADMTASYPSPSQPGLARVPASVRPYADQALRETCRRLLGAPASPHGTVGRGVLDERLATNHPAHEAQQQAWALVATYLDQRLQTAAHPTGRPQDMSEAAAGEMREVLRQIRSEASA